MSITCTHKAMPSFALLRQVLSVMLPNSTGNKMENEERKTQRLEVFPSPDSFISVCYLVRGKGT